VDKRGHPGALDQECECYENSRCIGLAKKAHRSPSRILDSPQSQRSGQCYDDNRRRETSFVPQAESENQPQSVALGTAKTFYNFYSAALIIVGESWLNQFEMGWLICGILNQPFYVRFRTG
jgi:hypothetical protein